ncbi:MAG: response regulator transcription factor [Chthoniobacterales bacterium]
MITAADLQTLSNATLRLYSPDLHTGNWVEHAFEFITTLVSADMVNYGNLDPRTGTMQATTTCDRSHWASAVVGFGTFMRKYEFFNFDPSVNGGRPFFRSDFISGRQFRDTDIWCECFRILETMDHAAVHVPTNDGRLAWFAAERGGSNDFDERDRLMLALGQEHLANSWKLALARQKVREEFPIDAATFAHAGFTPRESEVACWLVEGKTNAEIAALMKLQTQTVKSHVTSLFNKTGTGNRLALTLRLIELARTTLRRRDSLQTFVVREW